MAMTPTGLQAVLHAQLVAQFGTPADDTELEKFCLAVGTAVVTYIQSNADVLAGIISNGEVTGGSATGDPVTVTSILHSVGIQ